MSDDEPQIKVFASDDNLKTLGELLSNDSSRKIIYNLMNKEMYTNEISTKLDMRVSLVIHHLKKLEDLGLLDISEKKIKRKGVEHRFFKIRSNIFVVINKNKEEIKEQGLLTKIFKETTKFASIGITALLVWYYDIVDVIYGKDDVYAKPFNQNTEEFDSIEFSLITIIIGLIITIIFSYKKRKKI